MATDKRIRYEMQGGMKNYLGKQKMVKAPKYWKSRPDKPQTELAYITKAEKDLIMKSDLHGSLNPNVKGNYAPNEGPSGIISLDYQGDKGTYGKAGQSFGDREKSVSTTTGSPRGDITTTRTVSPKDTFTQSWSGPQGLFGLTGGYRDLNVPGDTSQGHKSRWGALGRGLLSLLGGVPGKVFSALSTLPKHKTLSSWWGGLSPTEEESTGTMPEGYHYNQQGKLTYNAPRPDMLGDYGFKSSVVGANPNQMNYNDVLGWNSLIGNDETDETVARPATNLYPGTGLGAADGGLITLL